MSKAETRVLTAHIPVSLAEKVDQLADQLERSRGWIVNNPGLKAGACKDASLCRLG